MLDPNEECLTVAVHGCRRLSRATVCDSFETLVALLESLGLSLERVQVDGGKPTSAARTMARIRAGGHQPSESLTGYALAKGGTIPVTDFDVTAAFLVGDQTVVVAVSQRSATATKVTLRSLVVAIWQAVDELEPTYAIGFSMPRCKGPALYAIGLDLGEDDSDDAYERGWLVSRWGDALVELDFDSGFLRAVYPENVLTHSQLSQKLDSGGTFADWLGKPGTPGTVESRGTGVLWSVPSALVSSCEAELRELGLTFYDQFYRQDGP